MYAKVFEFQSKNHTWYLIGRIPNSKSSKFNNFILKYFKLGVFEIEQF